ncbi:PREDICTED: nucleosome assembly protein 1-like 1-B isoform X1 [Vollenhovia emeryi]|uniref:nucleosome assembly protein 1-like 1-B isoform X1 n=2 Tax=Vollenhovia emeryi TaxID=411798 RepID=UPI0005F55CD3|nr:PREDICTED: nucleosome assembly protein 1-like 1-B isoform X1 [Vollenhovia emeryi]XP_011883122.1 PREDICTED: nucleosome assembly protein 1-like 1-B isoform X1 [Vollenhovia emeryi]XP_011883123.1 PREDICTED: nucleosome assembly protein 1-like 1-B isoform X1 [Vollenhovia emeryi]
MTTDPDRAANTSGTDSVEDEDDNHRKMLNRTDVLAALRDGITASGLEPMQSFPAPVKRRIKALKQLQLVTTNIEAKFYEEVHALECEYYKMCAPLYEKRSDIISGAYEPTDDQCVWDSDDDEETLNNYMKEKAKIEENVERKDEATENEDDIKGIPDFWLTIFKNVSTLSEMVQEHDEPILKYLHDIKVKFLPANPMGFILEFYFTPNEYFSNSMLTKEYIMKCTPDKNDPFSFEGPEIYKCKGCVIDWKKGKNVTIKTIKKNQKHKSRGSMRTVTKTVQNDSFFNFFNPPNVPEDSEADMDDETQALLTSDFELGHYIRERIVPRAVLYYTGEVLDDEDEDYEDEEDGDDEEDEEDEEEEASSPANPPSGGKPGDDPNECKQQ